MEVQVSLGMLITIGMFLIALVALIGPGTYKLGQMRRDVDHNAKSIKVLFDLVSKVDDLVREMRESRRNVGEK